MNRPGNIAAHYDKIRKALLRIVGAWLMFASWFASNPDRILPRRLSLLIDSQICKAELAAYCLRVAARHAELKHAPTLESLAHDEQLTIGCIIARLKAIIAALRSLRLMLKKRSHTPAKPSISFDKCIDLSFASHFSAQPFCARPCQPP